jgi:hypothetical protein
MSFPATTALIISALRSGGPSLMRTVISGSASGAVQSYVKGALSGSNVSDSEVNAQSAAVAAMLGDSPTANLLMHAATYGKGALETRNDTFHQVYYIKFWQRIITLLSITYGDDMVTALMAFIDPSYHADIMAARSEILNPECVILHMLAGMSAQNIGSEHVENIQIAMATAFNLMDNRGEKQADGTQAAQWALSPRELVLCLRRGNMFQEQDSSSIIDTLQATLAEAVSEISEFTPNVAAAVDLTENEPETLEYLLQKNSAQPSQSLIVFDHAYPYYNKSRGL